MTGYTASAQLWMEQGLTSGSDIVHTIPHVMFFGARILMAIRECDLPTDALLQQYDRDDGYADCYQVDVPGSVELSRYVEAFYTTWLFRAERTILSLAGHSSTDAEAVLLAGGQGSRFAAWHVEARDEDQLLMCDITGRTRSWFKVARITAENSERTMLYFGSGVTTVATGEAGRTSIGPVFKALTPVHIIYSRALLAAARHKIARSSSKVTA